MFFTSNFISCLCLTAWFNLFWDQFFTMRCIIRPIRMGVCEEWEWTSVALLLSNTIQHNTIYSRRYQQNKSLIGQNGAQWLVVTGPGSFSLSMQAPVSTCVAYLKFYVVTGVDLIRAWLWPDTSSCSKKNYFFLKHIKYNQKYCFWLRSSY